MTGTLISQLGKHGMAHRLPEVLEAIPQVRLDFGEPIMATPFSQFVGIQAVLNIVTDDPYSLVPDETVHYLLGHYGPVYGPVNQQVRDRILSTPRAQKIAQWVRPDPSLAEIRKNFTPGMSDEELLLRYMNGKEEVDATYANGPVRKDPRRSANAIVTHVVDLLAEKTTATSLSVTTPEFSLDLRKAPR
jgi:oxaloacetate decarboxylase alpha subunit